MTLTKKLVSTRKKRWNFRKLRKYCYEGLFCIAYLILAPFMIKQFWNSHQLKSKASVTEETQSTETVPEVTQSDSETETESVSSSEQTTEPETEPEEITESVKFVTSDETYFRDALIIGDSRTVGLRDYGTIPEADFFCTAGLAAYEILDGKEIDGRTLQDILNTHSYGKIYLMVGLNETAFGLDEFHEHIQEVYQMLCEACPDALIFLMANLHVSAQTSEEQPAISNEKINIANSYIEELADGKKSFYIDVNPLFDDEENCLSPEHSDDGIHVSGDDYARWTEWLCTQTITEESFPKTKTTTSTSTTFQEVMNALQNHQRVTRAAWGEGIYLQFIPETKSSDGVEISSYIAIKTTENKLTPWSASPEDLLAEDWTILENSE